MGRDNTYFHYLSLKYIVNVYRKLFRNSLTFALSILSALFITLNFFGDAQVCHLRPFITHCKLCEETRRFVIQEVLHILHFY